MKRHILETLLHEAVKVSKLEDVKELPLTEQVRRSLEHVDAHGTLTQSEREALEYLTRISQITISNLTICPFSQTLVDGVARIKTCDKCLTQGYPLIDIQL